MIVFIDTEVNPRTKKVEDYGALRGDGAVLHTHSKTDFDIFVSKCDTPSIVSFVLFCSIICRFLALILLVYRSLRIVMISDSLMH